MRIDTKRIFEEIVQKHYAQLLYYVKSIVKNHATAQDVLQETFISAYKAFNGYTEQGKVLPWLKTIARNTAYRHIHKESRLICVSLSEPVGFHGAQTEPNFFADEGYRHIMSIINCLPDQYRTVFYHRFVEGMPVKDVAIKLGIPQGTVKSKAHYGMQKVKTELKTYLIQGGHIMDCRKAYEYLYQYAKSAILPEDKAHVEKHLEVCKKCKDIADSLKLLVPQIKPAPEGIIRHYSIKFQVEDGLILGYFGHTNHVSKYKELTETLNANNGEVPKAETWFSSGFDSDVAHLAEFDNDGNRIEVEIAQDETGFQHIRYRKMKKVFEYHQKNSVSLSRESYGYYEKSYDAPNLYIAKTRNDFGPAVKSGLYLALPSKATNIRMRQGCDVLDCGPYKFIYDDRYVDENQTVKAECTYNM
ncbi:MAG: sigma-70 family RNA polymerase sigma factor [Firmicutes bacterium]|nr:sigma-70 family RNA polymerase sigma factor [Bacillota bacterium]